MVMKGIKPTNLNNMNNQFNYQQYISKQFFENTKFNI